MERFLSCRAFKATLHLIFVVLLYHHVFEEFNGTLLQVQKKIRLWVWLWLFKKKSWRVSLLSSTVDWSGVGFSFSYIHFQKLEEMTHLKWRLAHVSMKNSFSGKIISKSSKERKHNPESEESPVDFKRWKTGSLCWCGLCVSTQKKRKEKKRNFFDTLTKLSYPIYIYFSKDSTFEWLEHVLLRYSMWWLDSNEPSKQNEIPSLTGLRPICDQDKDAEKQADYKSPYFWTNAKLGLNFL